MFRRDDALYGVSGMSAEVLDENTVWGDESVAQFLWRRREIMTDITLTSAEKVVLVRVLAARGWFTAVRGTARSAPSAGG